MFATEAIVRKNTTVKLCIAYRKSLYWGLKTTGRIGLGAWELDIKRLKIVSGASRWVRRIQGSFEAAKN